MANEVEAPGGPTPKRPRKPRGTSASRRDAPIPERFSEELLRKFITQTFGRNRWTQDTPVVPDVWLAFMRGAEDLARSRLWGQPLGKTRRTEDARGGPFVVVPLLLTPWSGVRVGAVVQEILKRVDPIRRLTSGVAGSSSRVALDADLEALVCAILPGSGWWERVQKDRIDFEGGEQYSPSSDDDHDYSIFEEVYVPKGSPRNAKLTGRLEEYLRHVALIGFVRRLEKCETSEEYGQIELDVSTLLLSANNDTRDGPRLLSMRAWAAFCRFRVEYRDLCRSYLRRGKGRSLAPWRLDDGMEPLDGGGVWLVNLNRPAENALYDSRRTVKADAVGRLFDVTAKGITFAIVDDGIDATHRAFLKGWEGADEIDDEEPDPERREDARRKLRAAKLRQSRVRATYDFSSIQKIIGRVATDVDFDWTSVRTDMRNLKQEEYLRAHTRASLRYSEGLEIDWSLIEPLIRVSHDYTYEPPAGEHGTHVAGIIGADLPAEGDRKKPLMGMCPDIELYDFRVFAEDGSGDEFSILCALEFVQWLNRHRNMPVIHGVNLSLALVHDVDSFACGQTPICDACNRLVGAGTVVVAAAGNTGFDGNAKKLSLGNGYRTVSITDPGNAQEVITVGATHRRDPHAYGVSFFSARGPTGDGRMKPDLLAPGEKIASTLPNNRVDRLDGTSMAAPHVSGAAALLMARYPELIGRPRRIKEILMKSATDLGRERHFQGAGLLDVLRALQSV